MWLDAVLGAAGSPTRREDPLAQAAFATFVAGGPTGQLVEDLAVPKAVCGPTGSHKDTCLRTLAGGSYMGNMDTQRMGIGTTIYVECQVEGCGVGTGDVHGAQGDCLLYTSPSPRDRG